MSGPINLGIHWDPNFQKRTEAGFQRLQKEADGEFIRLVTPYVPVRTGALRGSAKDSTVLGSGLIRHTTPYAAAQYYRLPCGQGVREDGDVYKRQSPKRSMTQILWVAAQFWPNILWTRKPAKLKRSADK